MSGYVVAGATGRVGSSVASELLAAREEVTVIVRDEARGASWVERGAALAVGSLTDDVFLAHTLTGARGFFTLLPENVDAVDFHGHRRRMADSIARAVQVSGVAHVVMLSAVPAHLSEGNGPCADLHYMERRLRATNATITVVRAALFQDNVASIIALAREAGIYPCMLPNAEFAVPMTATRATAAVAANELCASAPRGDTVDVLGPAYSYRQLATTLGDAIGRPLTVVEIPPAAQVQALVDGGLPQPIAESVAELFATIAAGRVQASGDRAIMTTTTIDETVRALVGATPTSTPRATA